MTDYTPAELEIVKLGNVDVLATSGTTCEIVFCLSEATEGNPDEIL